MPSERTLRIAAAAASLVGIGIAGYLSLTEAGGELPKCVVGGGGGCETVAQSKYAELAGIEVAYLGLAGYVALLAAALIRGDLGRFGGALVATVGFGFSAYLTYLELFVIDAICQWCVVSAVTMTVLFALNAARAAAYLGRPAQAAL
ncbi:MAG: vitamin K epoxide reductase family protein [Solirubrobacterales bacterium]